jgi:AraC-like DNA-binding protein
VARLGTPGHRGIDPGWRLDARGVARTLALSPRTLQRRLNAHGMEFKGLVGETRQRFAVHYLKDRGNTLAEVAFLLGYSEGSAFNRARLPSEYQATLRK